MLDSTVKTTRNGHHTDEEIRRVEEELSSNYRKRQQPQNKSTLSVGNRNQKGLDQGNVAL